MVIRLGTVFRFGGWVGLVGWLVGWLVDYYVVS